MTAVDPDRCPAVCKMLDMHWGRIPNQCEGERGHSGQHWRSLDACEPPAQLVWLWDVDGGDA